jgi:hypothetical protein
MMGEFTCRGRWQRGQGRGRSATAAARRRRERRGFKSIDRLSEREMKQLGREEGRGGGAVGPLRETRMLPSRGRPVRLG